MKIYFLEDVNDVQYGALWYIKEYKERIVKFHKIDIEFTNTINPFDSSNSFYFRFIPHIKKEWLAYSKRIVCMFPWSTELHFNNHRFAARLLDGRGHGIMFTAPIIIGLQVVTQQGGFKHSDEEDMLPYTSIFDPRFKNKCDLLIEYLKVYNDMDKAGLIPIL